MKQKVFALCLAFLAALLPAASAASELPMVADNAGLFSDSQRDALEEKAQALRTEYEMDVVILTVSSLDGKTAKTYADDYFDSNGYGYGSKGSGFLFLLAMEERDWYITTCGDAVYALTDISIQRLGETIVVPYLSDGTYYEAFNAYLDALPSFLSGFQAGIPTDGRENDSADYYHGQQDTVAYYREKAAPNLLISVVIGAVSAAAVIVIMRTSMNTKRQQRSAGNYLRAGSFRLQTRQDLFLYSSTSKVRRQETSRGGSGGRGGPGGGTSIHGGGGGRNHGGGGGKF